MFSFDQLDDLLVDLSRRKRDSTCSSLFDVPNGGPPLATTQRLATATSGACSELPISALNEEELIRCECW